MRKTEDEQSVQDARDLLLRAKRGEQAAFDELYKLYFTPIYRYIYLRVRDKVEVEHLAQDVFIKVFHSIQSFEVTTASPLAYFFTVARNTIIDFWRKNRDKVEYGKDDFMVQVPDTAPGAAELFDRQELKAVLYKGLNKLTPEQREAITMRYFNDVPTREIAKHLGKNEEAVRQLQSRGLKALRGHLVELTEGDVRERENQHDANEAE